MDKSTARSAASALRILALALALLALLAVLRPRVHKAGLKRDAQPQVSTSQTAARHAEAPRKDSFPRLRKGSGPPQGAEEIVAGKLAQFSANRRKLTARLAERAGKPVPVEVQQFFDALEKGHWEEADAIFHKLHARHENPSGPADEALYAIWRPIQETQGIQSEARHWPPEQLLRYGEKVLGALRPDMVFIGGTDPGAFINTFLNDTSDGERHIIFTQNALADSSYLDYLNFLYADRLSLPSADEQQAAFSKYVADAAKRAAHDRDFPDEPAQVRPGENIQLTDNRVQVSGQTAVMAINELLLQRILEKNPNMSFALEESFSLKSTYEGAAPLGPVMELRAGEENALDAERANAVVENWRNTATELLASTTEQDEYPRRAWSHTAMAQGNLLSHQNFLSQAEEAYELAIKMDPGNTEAANALAELRTKRQ